MHQPFVQRINDDTQLVCLTFYSRFLSRRAGTTRSGLETVVDQDEAEAVKEAKEHAGSHAGILVVKREERHAVGEEGDPIIVFQSGRIGGFD